MDSPTARCQCKTVGALSSLTESLRIVRNHHVFDELRPKDAIKQTEIVRVQQATLANEQVAWRSVRCTPRRMSLPPWDGRRATRKGRLLR